MRSVQNLRFIFRSHPPLFHSSRCKKNKYPDIRKNNATTNRMIIRVDIINSIATLLPNPCSANLSYCHPLMLKKQ